MKNLLKNLILVATVTAFMFAAVFGCGGNRPDWIEPSPRPRREPDGHQAGWSLDASSSNLNFTVTSPGGRQWHSGRRHTERQTDEDGNYVIDEDSGDYVYVYADAPFNLTWQRRMLSGVSVGYRRDGNPMPWQGIENMAGNSVQLTQITGGYRARVGLPAHGFAFDVVFELFDGFVQVTVPFDSISETNDSFQLMFIQIAPFFGATFGHADGFIFIPDGSGAIIDTSLPTAVSQEFILPVYGDDAGVAGFEFRDSRSPRIVGMPVFAVSEQGAGATVSVLSGGAENADIIAYAAGITTNYNFALARFNYRHSYERHIGGGTFGDTIPSVQGPKNVFDAQMRFYLLDAGSEDIGSIANTYREYLEEMEMLPQRNLGGDTPLRVQFLMADNRPGMFGNNTVAMTTASFVKDAALSFGELTDNLSVSLLGFRSGGRSGTAPRHFGVEGSTGGGRAYRNMAAALEAEGIRVSYALDYMRGSIGGSGFRVRDTAMTISNQFVEAHSGTGHFESFRLLTINGMRRAMEQEARRRRDMNVKEVDFLATGHLLYSSWYHQAFSRSDMVIAAQSMALNVGAAVNMEMPNDYMWRHAASYLSAPMGSSGFLIAQSCVPFMSMVLSGSMDLFSEPQNLNWRGDNALRLIDFNIYPSFVLTERDSIELAPTQSAYIFTSRHSAWEQRVIELYNEVDGVLGNVRGQRIIRRYSPAAGIYRNVFSGGGTTEVNFNTGTARYIPA